jgi:rare lipoprotein A
MKSFVLSLVLLLTLGVAGSGSATAAVSNDAREAARRDRAATYQDSGTHLQRQRVARAQINDSYGGGYYYSEPRKRAYSSKQVTHKKRYAKRKTVRTAKHAKGKRYTQRQGKKRYAKRSSQRRTATARRTPRTYSSGPLGAVLNGIASFYWQPQRVAAGGWFNPNAMTAAHKTLPFGTRVRVTHLGNGRSVDVKINDRGPYIAGRIIDLSKAAAGVIGMQGQGIAKVKVTVLGRG